MHVVSHQHPGINNQPLFFLAILQRLYDYMPVNRARKYIHPVYHGVGNKINFTFYAIFNIHFNVNFNLTNIVNIF